jgi:hypothetical protein
MGHKEDMTLRHYKPAKYAPVCGVGDRVRARIKGGEESDEYATLRVPTTTFIGDVVCPECRAWIREIVLVQWEKS